jgi:ligand-binding sensor domain-containing protein
MSSRLLGQALALALLFPAVSLAQSMPPAASQGAPHGSAKYETFEVGEKNYVRSLLIDPGRKSLWVGSSVGALEVELATNKVKNTFTRKDGLANEYVFAVGVDPKTGEAWFGTNAGGASTLSREGKWKTWFPMHGLADYWIYAFSFDAEGKVWIGTWDGASHYDPKTGKFTNYRKELINVWVYGLDIDPEGRVWFGTEGGVSMLDKSGKWSSWTHKDGLGAKNVEDLPRSANTGLGTRQRHDLTVEAAGGKETFNPNYVFSAKVDAKLGGVWFGTWGGGVSWFDGKSAWKSYSTKDGLAGNIVYSIAQEADGTLWFGTNHGVSRYDGKSFTNFDRKHGLVGDNVYAIAVDPKGGVWVGTKGGVTRLYK